MKYNGIIQRKLSLLDNELLHLKRELKEVDFDAFSESWAIQRMTERSLQVMIEIVIDIAERIIALNNSGPAGSASEAMEKLELLGVIRSAGLYSQMVKFRNFIVHRYESISTDILYAAATKYLDSFVEFRREIESH